MPDTEVVKVGAPSKPLPHIANGVADALEKLAKRVREGRVYGFSFCWLGGPTVLSFTSPEKQSDAEDVPTPDPDDPIEKRRQETAAYFDGMFRALSETLSWNPKTSDRLKTEFPDDWNHTKSLGEKADEESHRYIDGEVQDPSLYRKAIDDMGTAWRAAYAKLAEADKQRSDTPNTVPANEEPPAGAGKYPF